VKLLLRPPDSTSSPFYAGQSVARLSLAQGEEAVVGGLCLGSWISALATATELAPRHELLQLVRPTGNLVTLVLEAGGRVRGVVRDGRGEPIPGARVGLYPLGVFAGQQTLADEQGRFEVGELPAGEVRLEAVDSRRRCNLDEVVAIESGGIALWSPVIPCGAQLAGRVVDGQGEPQAGVRVVVEAPDRPGSWLGFANTALDGSFTLFEALEEDNVVRVYDDGHRELLRRTGVLGNVTDLELVVDRVWAEVHVDVRLGGQSAGQEARLLASPLGERTGAFLQLDAEGVARSAPGNFELVLTHPAAGRIALGEQTLVAGERLELGTVQFAVPGWIDLRFPERTTATNTRVSIFDASSAEILSTTVDRLGTTRLGPLQPGAVRLELEHASGETLRFELQIRAGDTLAVEAQ
jgi:hypothetical protein